MLYGQAACGKSELAEDLCVKTEGRRLYVATMRPLGAEDGARIARHRAMRAGKGFETAEHYRDLGLLSLPGEGRYRALLLECVGNAVANALFEDGLSPERALRGVMDGVRALLGRTEHLVLVSNDIFSDGVCYPGATGTYLECMARVNRALALEAGAVAEVVCGLPICHKGKEILPL